MRMVEIVMLILNLMCDVKDIDFLAANRVSPVVRATPSISTNDCVLI